MTVVVTAYGAGTNSTAMLIGMVKRKEPVDLVLFADTGGERPETYEYRDVFSSWLISQGYPDIVTVQTVNKDGVPITLEQLCLEKKMLPSLAYGFKKCSLKFKKAPQDKYVNNWQPAREAWKRGEKVIKLMGFDVDEEHRVARNHDDKKYIYRHPLVEWEWDREKCLEEIRSVGLPLPGKSACFFCPASKVKEVLALSCDLKARALAMERNAELVTVKGLGRNWAWEDLIRDNENQLQLNLDHYTPDIACGCVD